MYSLVCSTHLDEMCPPPSESLRRKAGSEMPSFFKSIPPERIGLNGEYDHSGLAKRVDQMFRKQFNSQQLNKLCIAQRGGVVILTGRVPNRLLLTQMIETAISVMGATYVEADAVKIEA